MINFIKETWESFYVRLSVYLLFIEVLRTIEEKPFNIDIWIFITLLIGINQIVHEIRKR